MQIRRFKEEEIEVEEVGEVGEEDIETDSMEVDEEDDEDDDFYTVDEYSDEELEGEEKDDNDENYEEEEDIRMNMNASKKEAKSSRVHAKRGVTSTRNDGKAAARIVAGRKNTEAEELEKICKDLSRLGPRPSETPYFISSLRPRNQSDLYIPQNLIRDHNFNIPEEMIIGAEDGKEFISRITAWGDGRKVVTNGWRAFCEARRKVPLRIHARQEVTDVCSPVTGRKMDVEAKNVVYKKADLS